MSLKSVKVSLSRIASLQSLSIAQRLISISTLSAFGILIIIESFLYYALVGSLEHENRQILVDKIDNLRVIIKEGPEDISELRQELVRKIEQRYLKYYARISDEQNNILADNFDKSLKISSKDFPVPVGENSEPSKMRLKSYGDGDMLLLMSAWAQGRDPGRRRFLIQTAVDVSHEADILRSYRLMAGVALIAGMLISGVVVAFIGRRALKPLVKITGVIQRIRATKLTQRVNPSQWPKELRELATSFDEMLDRLEDSFVRLSEFSSDLAHELRTPVTNLIGEAEVILARPRTLSEYQQYVESSLEELNKLAHIIENLLFLAKTESTDIRIEPILLDACKEIMAVLDYADAVIEERNIKVTCKGSAALYADPLLFKRVISNLVSNSLNYTLCGGRIDIFVATLPDQSVTITITDTGIGIPPEDISRIFNRFHRGENAKSLDAHGTGLGLAIVKSIMELHNGKVAITSTLSQGTTVILTFPGLV